MASQNIQFNSKNYLPLTNASSWGLQGGAYLADDASLCIPYGGSVYYDIQAFKQKQFSFYKIVADIVCQGFDHESSLDTDGIILLQLIYTDYTGAISTSETCSMNLDTSSPVNEASGEYLVTKILDTANLPISSCKISIINNLTGYDLYIKTIKLYVSEDFSESQFVDTLNKYLEQNKIRRCTVGVSSDETELRYLKAYTNGSDEYLKIKPIYSGNKLLEISMSNGESIVIDYETDEDEEDA